MELYIQSEDLDEMLKKAQEQMRARCACFLESEARLMNDDVRHVMEYTAKAMREIVEIET